LCREQANLFLPHTPSLTFPPFPPRMRSYFTILLFLISMLPSSRPFVKSFTQMTSRSTCSRRNFTRTFLKYSTSLPSTRYTIPCSYDTERDLVLQKTNRIMSSVDKVLTTLSIPSLPLPPSAPLSRESFVDTGTVLPYHTYLSYHDIIPMLLDDPSRKIGEGRRGAKLRTAQCCYMIS